MVKLEIEVSEKVAKLLNHPQLNDTFVVDSSGQLIEEALEEALKVWTDGEIGIEQQLEAMTEMDKGE